MNIYTNNEKTHSRFAKKARMGFVQSAENQLKVYIDVDKNVQLYYNSNGAERRIIFFLEELLL